MPSEETPSEETLSPFTLPLLSLQSLFTVPSHSLPSAFVLQARAVAQPVTRKAIVASDEEVAANPRSRSAKLRIVEKLPQRVTTAERDLEREVAATVLQLAKRREVA